MNITKNPLFSCMTDKENPYIDILTFKSTNDEVDRITQMTTFLDFACSVLHTVSYVYIYPNKKYSSFYTDILKDVEKYPQNFHSTKQEVEWAFKEAFGAIERFAQSYRKDKFLKKEMLDCELVIFNETYYENVLNLVINKIYFVDGLVRMAKCFENLVK